MQIHWEIVGLSATITAGGIAWLYQKAVERQERRIARYERIMELANSFLRASTNPDGIDATLSEIRKLWLSAPLHVVQAATLFREASDGINTTAAADVAFRAFVKAMRKDCTLSAALIPRVALGQIQDRDIQLMVARRP